MSSTFFKKFTFFFTRKDLHRTPMSCIMLHNKMNGYDVIIRKITEWARHNPDIRAVIIIGSRARIKEPADKWSDLDSIIIAHDITKYRMTNKWISKFGTPLLLFNETAFDGSLERRVLYADFCDVDFVLTNIKKFKASIKIAAVQTIFYHGYKMLVDKDNVNNLLDKIKEQNYTGMTDDMIINEIHDYLYHCVWLVKKIKRGELWTAMNCLNCYMKNKLLHMIEVYTHYSSGQYVWHNGRMLERWANRSLLKQLKGCFADYNKQMLKESLLHQMDVYHELAAKTAGIRNIPYPLEQREMIIQWIDKMLK